LKKNPISLTIAKPRKNILKQTEIVGETDLVEEEDKLTNYSTSASAGSSPARHQAQRDKTLIASLKDI